MVTLRNSTGEEQEIELREVMENPSIRIFNVTGEDGLIFAVARDSGQVWLTDVTEIEIG